MRNSETFNAELYGLLKTRGYKPVPLDTAAKPVPNAEIAAVIQNTFIKNGKEYGKFWVSIDKSQNLIVYYDTEQQDSPDNRTPGLQINDTWTGCLKQLKSWAMNRQLSFELLNKDRLSDDMKQREYYKMKEQMSESDSGKKRMTAHKSDVQVLSNHGVKPEQMKMAKDYLNQGYSHEEAAKKAKAKKPVSEMVAGPIKDQEDRVERAKALRKKNSFTQSKNMKSDSSDKINEVSASKLGSYVRNASTDKHTRIDKSLEGEKAFDQNFHNTPEWKKVEKRHAGIELAKNKLTRDSKHKGLEGVPKQMATESYHPINKKSSYNDAVPNVKIVLQHSRALEEGEQRYRSIERIFLENESGERFLAPTNRPGIAKVYARHIAEGGNFNDERWNHIKSLCEEYKQMANFVRATKNKKFTNESAQSLVNEGVVHYTSLRETLSRMTGHRGYSAYFESWTPTLMENDGVDDISSVNDLFVQESSIDPRIESVIPILSRIHKKVNEMNETKEFDSWVDSVVNEHMQELDEEKEPWMGQDLETPSYIRKQKYDDAKKDAELGGPKLRTVKDKSKDEEVEESLDGNQKRAGQLGPTEKVGKNEKNLRGKLVGCSESTVVENTELAAIRRLSGLN